MSARSRLEHVAAHVDDYLIYENDSGYRLAEALERVLGICEELATHPPDSVEANIAARILATIETTLAA